MIGNIFYLLKENNKDISNIWEDIQYLFSKYNDILMEGITFDGKMPSYEIETNPENKLFIFTNRINGTVVETDFFNTFHIIYSNKEDSFCLDSYISDQYGDYISEKVLDKEYLKYNQLEDSSALDILNAFKTNSKEEFEKASQHPFVCDYAKFYQILSRCSSDEYRIMEFDKFYQLTNIYLERKESTSYPISRVSPFSLLDKIKGNQNGKTKRKEMGV